jgi:hypothetical protein
MVLPVGFSVKVSGYATGASAGAEHSGCPQPWPEPEPELPPYAHAREGTQRPPRRKADSRPQRRPLLQRGAWLRGAFTSKEREQCFRLDSVPGFDIAQRVLSGSSNLCGGGPVHAADLLRSGDCDVAEDTALVVVRGPVSTADPLGVCLIPR